MVEEMTAGWLRAVRAWCLYRRRRVLAIAAAVAVLALRFARRRGLLLPGSTFKLTALIAALAIFDLRSAMLQVAHSGVPTSRRGSKVSMSRHASSEQLLDLPTLRSESVADLERLM